MLTVTDGDTVKCFATASDDQGQLLRILGDGAPYVNGVDAPETRGNGCLAEAMLGQLAKRRLQELIETPGMVIEDSGEVDTRDRLLVTPRMPDGQTVGQMLIDDEGLAGVWTPEDSQVDWCS